MVCDVAVAQACVTAFSQFSLSVDPAVKCAPLATYTSCITNWATGCGADAAITTFVTARDAVVTAAATICSTPTTTVTAWDSSILSGSGTSLDSLNSGSLSSDSSYSDLSASYGSLGSNASGSSGSFLQIWQWFVLAALLCLGAAALAGMMSKKKPKKTKKKAVPAPAPAPAAPQMVVEPLLPPMMPLATTSTLIPSYSMMAAPQYQQQLAAPQYQQQQFVQQYAAPATTAYAPQYQPQQFQQYAAPVQYAAPATTAYAPQYQQQQFQQFASAPAYATTAYAAPVV